MPRLGWTLSTNAQLLSRTFRTYKTTCSNLRCVISQPQNPHKVWDDCSHEKGLIVEKKPWTFCPSISDLHKTFFMPHHATLLKEIFHKSRLCLYCVVVIVSMQT